MISPGDLKGLAALITGAGRGIGKAVAVRLAQAGIHVLLAARSCDALERTAQEIQDQGGRAMSIPCDLSLPEEVQRLAQEVGRTLGKLDILINNAGIGLKKPFYETTNEEWSQLFQVNTFAPFILCRECLPRLKQSSQATIINIGSVVGIKGYELQAAYSASKHALMGFTKVLAQEVQPFGVRVHAINPGGVYTDMVNLMRPDLDPTGLIQPEEIAELVWFLLAYRGNAMMDDLHIRRANGAPWYG